VSAIHLVNDIVVVAAPKATGAEGRGAAGDSWLRRRQESISKILSTDT